MQNKPSANPPQAATVVQAIALSAGEASTLQKPDKPTSVVVQPVADGIDKESLRTRVVDVADLRDQFHGASPPRTIYVYYVTAAGKDAAAAHAAELFCHVPSFEQNPLWNPTGDLFCIRPVDLFRRLYDELSLALRWFVAAQLTADEDYNAPGGAKSTRRTRLFFAATETLRREQGKPRKEMHVVAITEESYKLAKSELSKKDKSDEWRCAGLRLKKAGYIATCPLISSDDACGTATSCFNTLEEIGTQGSEEEILDNTMRGVLVFFRETDKLFKQCKSQPLHNPKLEKAFSDHLRQLHHMEKFSKKMSERLRQPIVNLEEVHQLLAKLIASQERHEDERANFQLQMQLALTFGTHF
ncbi:hypothetical protein HDU89_001646 [Geranomyces variabilis]|nr:hypothetical protein HDU89_001646 [Geranomyces variabilis]